MTLILGITVVCIRCNESDKHWYPSTPWPVPTFTFLSCRPAESFDVEVVWVHVIQLTENRWKEQSIILASFLVEIDKSTNQMFVLLKMAYDELYTEKFNIFDWNQLFRKCDGKKYKDKNKEKMRVIIWMYRKGEENLFWRRILISQNRFSVRKMLLCKMLRNSLKMLHTPSSPGLVIFGYF